MWMALLALGVILIVFGAVILLRYSDRPGGTIKWMGAEVSSTGAGLPLIALGVACVIFGVKAYTPVDDHTKPKPEPPSIAVTTNDSCLVGLLDSIPPERIGTFEVGGQGEVVGAHVAVKSPFALLLTENGKRIGALRLALYAAKNHADDVYKIERSVDARCIEVTDIQNVSRGGDPRRLINFDTMGETLPSGRYQLRIGGEGGIYVSEFVRIGSGAMN